MTKKKKEIPTSVECYWKNCILHVPVGSKRIAHCCEEHYQNWLNEEGLPPTQKEKESPSYFAEKLETFKQRAKLIRLGRPNDPIAKQKRLDFSR